MGWRKSFELLGEHHEAGVRAAEVADVAARTQSASSFPGVPKRLLLLALAGLASIALAEGDVPFEPTSHATVRAMLEAAGVGPNDFVIDLGSGDGRIVIAAARDFGARGLGVDLDVRLVEKSRKNAVRARVADRVEFRVENLFDTDLSRATVLTLYLWPEVNLRLRDEIFRQMKPGSRVVSHEHDMGDWEPDAVVVAGEDTIYFWVVPARTPTSTTSVVRSSSITTM